MNCGKAFAAWCAANATLKALVRNRVEPIESYQDETRPRLTYSVISDRRLRCLYQTLLKPVRRFRLQVNIYANTYDQQNAIYEAIIGIEGYKGLLVSNDVWNVQVDDAHETPSTQGATARRLPEASIDLMFWIGEQ